MTSPRCTCGHYRSKHHFPKPFTPGRLAPCTAVTDEPRTVIIGWRFVTRMFRTSCRCRNFTRGTMKA